MNELFPITNKPDEFELFWSLYPRKVGKLAAQRALKKALKTSKLNDIINAVRVFSAQIKLKATATEFIPHPSTWLNAGRYLDEHGRDPGGSASAHGTSNEEWAKVWQWRLKDYKPGGFWSSHWGSRPEHGGTDVPRHLMAEWERGR